MFLIADSGSTKTDWIFSTLEEGVVKMMSTPGFNPIVQKVDFIKEQIHLAFDQDLIKNEVTHVFYFGAGCSSDDRKDIIKNILKDIFINAEIEVEHDMKAAVIATCGDEPGFSCILGTGSNAVYFDGKNIIPPKGSLGVGYILGDEGSGAHIGKIILRDFLYRALPNELQQHLEKDLGLDKDIILHNVYQRPNANTYLASITKEINGFRHLPYIQQVLNQVFTEFFKYNIEIFEHHKVHPVHFIGSIATHFDTELRQAALPFGIQVGNILQKPIENIVRYYLQKAEKDPEHYA